MEFGIGNVYKLSTDRYYIIFKILDEGELEIVCHYLDHTFPSPASPEPTYPFKVVVKSEFLNMLVHLGERAKFECLYKN